MRASRGEIKIEEILKESGLIFREEYSFEGLNSSNGRPLRFDFAVFDDDGNVFMIYKGRGYVSAEDHPYRFGQMKLLYAKGNNAFSLERTENNLMFGGVGGELEDPFVWYDNGYHMIAKDMEGDVCGVKFGVVHAFSDDGEKWEVDKEPFLTRDILYEDGKIRHMGNMERPCILFEDGKPVCAYFSTSDGSFFGGFMDCKNTWVVAIPLGD